jgi:thiol-disulfide isomerase/thioredoxin
MHSRITLISALAVAVPVIAVLVAVAVLSRPSSSNPSAATGGAPAVSANQSAGQAPIESKPAVAPRATGPTAPDFDGGGNWINSQPLKLADLKGKVVLVDFWTYGCYNCQNTLPYVKQWWEKYKDQGLVIVGVHTPEFDAEHELANVQRAVERERIGWPIVQDNDYTIWRAYGNHYWPHFYLVDDRGQIIYDHIGEGAYEETDRQIAAALAAKGQ